MVWRIHFTADDLERIQVRPTLGPLAETVKAMGLLRCPQQPRATYRQWRGQVKDRLTPQMAAFTAMIPPGSKGVDLSMLTGPAATLEQGIQALLTVPREHLLTEMEFVDREAKLPAAGWAAAEPGQARLQRAAAAVASARLRARSALRPAAGSGPHSASGDWSQSIMRFMLSSQPARPTKTCSSNARDTGGTRSSTRLARSRRSHISKMPAATESRSVTPFHARSRSRARMQPQMPDPIPIGT